MLISRGCDNKDVKISSNDTSITFVSNQTHMEQATNSFQSPISSISSGELSDYSSKKLKIEEFINKEYERISQNRILINLSDRLRNEIELILLAPSSRIHRYLVDNNLSFNKIQVFNTDILVYS